MLQRVVLNRPGLWSAVSAASVFTSRVSSYLTNSLGKLFPQGKRISKTTHPPSHSATARQVNTNCRSLSGDSHVLLFSRC